MERKKALKWIAFLSLIGALGYASSMDYEDEQVIAEDYCKMVEDGIWPNYKNLNCSKAGN